jgi:mono/diheme cytochrome c family protein
MDEVTKLQLIGLTVVGTGVVILLFIRAQFARVIGFVAIVLGLFSLVALSVPQMASLPPAEEKFDIATVKTPTDMAAIGQKIFFSKGQCALCHSIGPSESARCPDLKGIGAKLSREFIFESLTQPQAYIYLDYRHEGLPKEYPARMPYINKNPIGLTKNEILSVIAFLQQMSGEPISVNPSELEVPGQTPSAPVKAEESVPVAVAQARWGGIHGRIDQTDYLNGRDISAVEVRGAQHSGLGAVALQSHLSVPHAGDGRNRHLLHDERRVEGCFLGTDSALPDR